MTTQQQDIISKQQGREQQTSNSHTVQFSTGKPLHNLRLQKTIQPVHKQGEQQWGCWTTLTNTLTESEGNRVITIHPN